jgi:RNA 2',3'-cyclic 3'-phosphodiesterase
VTRGELSGGGPVRLFFALWPDDTVRRALAEWATALHRMCGGRVMQPGKLHMTLAFLGDTDRARCDNLLRMAAGVAPRRLEVVLDRPGYWKHNRIAWAGASQDPRELTELVGELRGALTDASFRFDTKPFVSHVTLLRKASAPAEMPVLPPIVWRARGFALVRSAPGPDGVDYTVDGAWDVDN